MRKLLSNLNSVGRKIAALVMLAIGILFAALLLINAFADFPLWVLGKTMSGVVEEKWYELIDENEAGELSFTYFANYSFITPEGEKFAGSSQLSAQEWSALVEGGEVRVLYARFNPANNRIDDTRFRPLLICSYIPFTFLAGFFLVQGWEVVRGEFTVNKPVHWRLEKKKQ